MACRAARRVAQFPRTDQKGTVSAKAEFFMVRIVKLEYRCFAQGAADLHVIMRVDLRDRYLCRSGGQGSSERPRFAHLFVARYLADRAGDPLRDDPEFAPGIA